MKFHKWIEVEIEAKEYGKRLARVTSIAQAQFFEGLREGFEEFSKGDMDGMQFLHISKEMSEATRAFIRKFAEYTETHNE